MCLCIFAILFLCVCLFVFCFFLYIEGADNSIMYFGQVFYMKKHLNEWEMKFIVVKHIEAFTMVGVKCFLLDDLILQYCCNYYYCSQYIKSKLKQYEKNVQVNIRFSSSHIMLVLDREEAAKGWGIEPYSDPLVVSIAIQYLLSVTNRIHKI